MKKPTRRLTAAQKAEKRRRGKEYMMVLLAQRHQNQCCRHDARWI